MCAINCVQSIVTKLISVLVGQNFVGLGTVFCTNAALLFLGQDQSSLFCWVMGGVFFDLRKSAILHF